MISQANKCLILICLLEAFITLMTFVICYLELKIEEREDDEFNNL